jgi:hypothetical protein
VDDVETAIESAPDVVIEAAVVEVTVEPAQRHRELTDDSLVNAKSSLAEALDELVDVLKSPDAVRSISEVDRSNLAKYLTIAKLRLENAIALVRSGDSAD